MKIDMEELKESKKKNFDERMKFVEFWANYIKTHPDDVWSEQQNVIINGQYNR